MQEVLKNPEYKEKFETSKERIKDIAVSDLKNECAILWRIGCIRDIEDICECEGKADMEL